MVRVTITIAATIWLLISLAVILNSVKAPPRFAQAALGLVGLEFVLVVLAFSGRQRVSGPSETIVSYVTPALAGALTLYAIAYGLRRHRVANG